LRNIGFEHEKAQLIAHKHTQSNCDGVASHGLNRFPLFVEYVQRGLVMPDAVPTRENAFQCMEQWDGHMGSGVYNAHACMNRAIALADEYGLGLVALRHTNHWMRGGTYGWQAADAGAMAICFTNTKANMAPWGGAESRIGNNPLVMAMPHPEGHLVLDMSMSQFSFGKMSQYEMRGEQLPFAGGWDQHQQLTTDPAAIRHTGLALPAGYWKGSALSVMLDVFATVLSQGKSTARIGSEGDETGISQIFVAIRPERLSSASVYETAINDIVNYIHHSRPMPEQKTRYPGERTLHIRNENMQKGVPVDQDIWESIVRLTKK
jgi:3-dehydro-L-gulonate 2-dehydrogenase